MLRLGHLWCRFFHASPRNVYSLIYGKYRCRRCQRAFAAFQ